VSTGIYLTPYGAGIVEMPSANGGFRQAGLVLLQRQSLPTDPVGTTTVTFSGIQADTEIRVYLPDGTEVAGIESCAANQVLTWSVYAPGANSTMYITLLKRGYRWQRFPYTPVVGAQNLPIFQIVDLGYSNPV